MASHQSTIRIMYGLSGGLAYHSQLPVGQNNCPALAIILSVNSCRHDMEEGATHDKIQEQIPRTGRENV
jgi:hypothetical protein